MVTTTKGWTGECATSIYWAETSDDTKHNAMYETAPPTTRDHPSPNVNCVKIKKLHFNQNGKCQTSQVYINIPFFEKYFLVSTEKAYTNNDRSSRTLAQMVSKYL